MIPCTALLLALFGADSEGLRLVATGALERLDRPKGAPLWNDVEVGVGWRSKRWSPDVFYREVRRWSLRDAEMGLLVSSTWGTLWRTELAGTKGFQDKFLATWTVRGRTERAFGEGWVVGAEWKSSDYHGFLVHQPGLGFDKYIGAWRLGSVLLFPWTSGDWPRVGGKVSVARDWSDAGGVSLDLSSYRELEAGSTGAVDRQAHSVAVGVRQQLGRRVVARGSGTWSRLENTHERMEVRLGLECFLGP